jgi:S-adenosylmethionine:tRNA ribosyltransferase-isomerase
VTSLATDLFDYELPDRLIAQTPAARRDASRLLVVDRASRQISHHIFTDLPLFLKSGDTLFRNNAAVLPARLRAVRPSGGQVECFLLRPIDGESVWRCLIKPGKRLPVGATFAHAKGEFRGEILAKETDGSALVRLTPANGETIVETANRLGAIPLPPYIQRTDDGRRDTDKDRYQTVYANRAKQVAVAAPTAGLHFTPELLQALTTQGVASADITLHVGLGTFRPIMTATVEAHDIHHELYELPATTQTRLHDTPGRRVAVGTTTVRTIEHFLRTPSARAGADYYGEADIYIYPPGRFLGVDALITNFHQPRSTLLCLVAAFLSPGSTAGITWLKEIYAEAISREYRFFSYGDAMLIL